MLTTAKESIEQEASPLRSVDTSTPRPCFSSERAPRLFQGLGGMLIRKVDGDWFNVVGFPAASFFKFLDLLVEEEEDFLSID